PAAPARTSRFRPATSSYWPTSDPTVTPGDMSGFGLDQPHAAVRPPEDDGPRPRRGEPDDEERAVREQPARPAARPPPHPSPLRPRRRRHCRRHLGRRLRRASPRLPAPGDPLRLLRNLLDGGADGRQQPLVPPRRDERVIAPDVHRDLAHVLLPDAPDDALRRERAVAQPALEAGK